MAETKKTVAAKAVSARVEAVKTEAEKAAPVKAEAPAKAEAAKTEKKAAAAEKTPVKKTPAKKAPAKKTTTRKTAVKESVCVQFDGKSYTTEELVKIAKDVWKYDLKQKAGEFQTVELFVKPEEAKVYYVINGDTTGDFAI